MRPGMPDPARDIAGAARDAGSRLPLRRRPREPARRRPVPHGRSVRSSANARFTGSGSGDVPRMAAAFPLPGRTSHPLGDQTFPCPPSSFAVGGTSLGDRRTSSEDLNFTATAHHAQTAGEVAFRSEMDAVVIVTNMVSDWGPDKSQSHPPAEAPNEGPA